ncbi:hypothetical protein WICANDRAFT_26843 [Wickerhamomyces anomalus NRRL Y-366-8]|uniref:Major facilitator superfamily (MFS) profile domain-containing protein n=1 Tax=Wickerhamomyces anomalus (strain ATCC 58044 / CBS 1984 / NCYC 433 / NRRL Y-366-8) TaxID=683960 RepID=A0A1E3PC29_WICAA|nr:uncharacterized protein WICANDRAFT_26843 [Wickerhamomyces anomalus NRRL Y-366-8]ODQ62437.1 hypothetical protein WICANDRAFT_26843 [Wickerhamomyces anomalus NRRL Y-366-8]
MSSGLFEKTTEKGVEDGQVSYNTSDSPSVQPKDVQIDSTHDKITKLQLDPNFNFDKELEELEILAANYKADRTALQRLCGLEVELNFKNKKNMVILLGVFSAAAGLLSGLDQSIISGASIGMNKMLHLTEDEASLVSSLMPLGAVLGAIMMAPLSTYLGRRTALIISCIWYTIGSALCAGSMSHHMMYAGRFLLGIGIGIEGSIGMYISESCPARVRGNIVSLYQLNIALGEVIGYAVAAMFYEVHGGWRFMVGSSLLFSTAVFIGLFFLPESPRWLVHKGRTGEAFAVWKRLRDINDPQNILEFLEVKQAVAQEHEREQHETTLQRWSELFLVPRNRRALFYAVVMILLGQITGINAILYNMSSLMSKIGFDEKKSVFMSLVGGGALLLGTIPATVTKKGRRIWSMNLAGCFVGLALVGGGYLIDPIKHKSAALGVYLSGLILYMSFFGSYACLTWVVPSEVFNTKTRSIGMSICSALLYLISFAVTYNFAKMKKAFTYTGLTLGFYGGIALIGLIYQIIFMPETKDKTLEEIDDVFSKSPFTIARENIVNIKRKIGKQV